MATTVKRGTLAVTIALASVFAALAVPATTAGAATAVNLSGGTTSVTSSPGVTYALLRNGILPLPIGGAQEGLVLQAGGLGVRAAFPVTGGSVDPTSLAGSVTHSGGLLFVNFARLKYVTVSDFTIVIDGNPRVIATRVNGQPAALTVFDLDLSKATITKGAAGVSITGIVPTLSADAASALNTTLGTGVFTPGLVFGTAQTFLVPAA